MIYVVVCDGDGITIDDSELWAKFHTYSRSNKLKTKSYVLKTYGFSSGVGERIFDGYICII